MTNLLPYLLLIFFYLVVWLGVALVLPAAFKAAMRIGKRVSRWILNLPLWRSVAPIATRVPRSYLPVFVIVAAGIIVSLAAGWAFLELAEGVRENSPELRAVDQRVHFLAREVRRTSATPIFVGFTLAGTPVGLAIIASIVGIVLLFQGRYRWVAYLAVTSIGGGLLNKTLKLLFARARPDLAEAIRQSSGFSFPSGHAMGSIVVMGAISYLALRSIRSPRLRSAAVAAAITFVIIVSMSRIYLGVHWISDVGAGLTAGALWLTATTLGYEVVRRIRAVRRG